MHFLCIMHNNSFGPARRREGRSFVLLKDKRTGHRPMTLIPRVITRHHARASAVDTHSFYVNDTTEILWLESCILSWLIFLWHFDFWIWFVSLDGHDIFSDWSTSIVDCTKQRFLSIIGMIVCHTERDGGMARSRVQQHRFVDHLPAGQSLWKSSLQGKKKGDGSRQPFSLKKSSTKWGPLCSLWHLPSKPQPPNNLKKQNAFLSSFLKNQQQKPTFIWLYSF